MARWKTVKWTEAGQVASLLGWEDDLGADAASPPETYFAKLRQQGRKRDAVYFLGQSLPRYETVAWAAQVVRELSGPDEANDPALKAVLDWTTEPVEPRRRAAYDAAMQADARNPARMAALAAFFSGGSMSPEGQPAVPSPRTAAGRLGAAAVLLAADRTKDLHAALDTALDRGAAIAAEGVKG